MNLCVRGDRLNHGAAAAAVLIDAAKLIVFVSHRLSKGSWKIRCGRHDKLFYVVDDHDDDDSDR
jgi:hypothetical protein